MEQKNRCIRLSVCAIEGDDCRAKFFTGLTWDVFSRTYEFFEPFAGKKTKDSMPFIDQFFVTLVTLLKNRYTILQGTIPIQLLKSQTDEASDETTISSIDKIVTVCAALINLGEGIVVK